MLPKKILYFIEDTSPSEAEFEHAKKVGTLTFRSLAGYSDSDFIETCDAVAGKAPERYLAKFPYAEVPEAPKEEVPVPATQSEQPVQPTKPWDK